MKDLPVEPFVYRELTMEKDGLVGLLAVPGEAGGFDPAEFIESLSYSKSEKEEEDNASND